MKKSTISKIRQKIAVILIVLMCIESPAAIVGDSDGGAFVTKGEFEQMKADFNEQIEKYNDSIDNKVDGAIASYLAGNLVAIKKSVKNISYDKYGILSPRANNLDLNWKEGVMKCDMTGFGIYWRQNDMGNSGDGCGQQKTICGGRDMTDFYELGIRDIDYVKNFARWDGKYRTRQTGYFFGYDYVEEGYTGATPPTEMGLNAGFYPVSDVDNLTTRDKDVVRRDFFWLGYGSATDYEKGIGGAPKWHNILRYIYEATNSSIICTPRSVPTTRFSDFDNFRDWYNDTNTEGHTRIYRANAVLATASYQKQLCITPNSRQMTYWNGYLGLDSLVNNPATRVIYMPYMGFSSRVKNYNQLWTNKYDNIVGSLIEYDDKTQYYEDANKVKHLWLSAGAPTTEVKKEDIFAIECSFSDNVAHDVWFKIGAFDKNKEANDDDCILPSTIYKGQDGKGTKATVGSKSKAIRINAREKIYISFECEKPGYVFLKWSISGNNGAGGGTFMSPENVLVTSTK